jgi:hypothetical protein
MSDSARTELADEAAFAAALLDPRRACPPGLRSWNGSDPTWRLNVYRNNVVSSLVDVLADSFPVTGQLVGEEFFRAMAAVFVRRHLPASPVLMHYGDAFAAFIGGFGPAQALPYLPDVARLEFARLRACHAADAEPVSDDVVRRRLEDAGTLAELRFHLHPSLQLVESDYAVVSLWEAHQAVGDIQPVGVDRAERAIVLRDGLDVLVLAVGAGSMRFVERCLAGDAYGEAAAAASAVDPSFDLAFIVSLLILHRALVALVPPQASPSPRRSFM